MDQGPGAPPPSLFEKHLQIFLYVYYHNFITITVYMQEFVSFHQGFALNPLGGFKAVPDPCLPFAPPPVQNFLDPPMWIEILKYVDKL